MVLATSKPDPLPASTHPAVGTATGRPSATTFRHDIQGLRGLAVLLVLVYHFWPAMLPGGYVGVDVFFVISGFLITRILLDELQGKGRIDLWRFYERRARRLLPAATVVLACVAIAARVLLPATEWDGIGAEVLASALYFQNWWLAAQSVDYLQEGTKPGPLQHYWSLSVEEQFYLVWPALLLVAAALLRSRFALQQRLRASMLAVLACSLACSVLLTGASPGEAYFVTTTRAWELALGGLLAWHRTPPGTRTASLLAWTGLVAILSAAVLYGSRTLFPGYAALLPVLGSAAVLLGGTAASFPMASRVLGAVPLRYLGDISYSLYLWHWPVVVLADAAVPGSRDSVATSLLLLLVTIVLADLSKRQVEDRFRRPRAATVGARSGARPAVRLALVGSACVALSVGSAALLFHGSASQAARDRALVQEQGIRPVGAAAIGLPPPTGAVAVPFVPTLTDARQDAADVYRRGCHGTREAVEPEPCLFGVDGAGFRVVLAGDSHAAQWVPALQQIASERGWELASYTKSGCPFATATIQWQGEPYQACDEWNQRLVARLADRPPDILVTSHYVGHMVHGASSRANSVERMAAALSATWRMLHQRGSAIVVIRDTPRMGFDVVQCLASGDATFADCSLGIGEAFALPDALVAAAAMTPEARLLDLTDDICQADRCYPVVGNVLVYRDPNHLTATYVRTLTPQLQAFLEGTQPGRGPARIATSAAGPDAVPGPAPLARAAVQLAPATGRNQP